MGRKHCGKGRNCSLGAISPFPTVFSKDLNCGHIKTRACMGKRLSGFQLSKFIYSKYMYNERYYNPRYETGRYHYPTYETWYLAE